MVLDRGNLDDWFESRFIVFFFAVAMFALVVGVIWELHHDDPVVEFALLKERNFALANCLLFSCLDLRCSEAQC